MKLLHVQALVALAGVVVVSGASAQQTSAPSSLTQKEVAQGFRAEAPVTMGPQAAPNPGALREPGSKAKRYAGPETWPEAVRAIFVGVSGGVGFANVKHPQVGTPHVLGPRLTFQVGYRVSKRWGVSLVYTDFQQSVSRANAQDAFGTSTSFLRTAAGCNNCRHLGGLGGDVLATTFRLASVGPAFDVTPFGRDGLFLGAQGGVAWASLIDTAFGAAGTARAGFRLRPVENLAIAVEGGAQGQIYSGGSAALGYGGAEVRLNF